MNFDNKISLIKNKLILPIDDNLVISAIYILLENEIIKEQIEYVYYDNIELLSNSITENILLNMKFIPVRIKSLLQQQCKWKFLLKPVKHYTKLRKD